MFDLQPLIGWPRVAGSNQLYVIPAEKKKKGIQRSYKGAISDIGLTKVQQLRSSLFCHHGMQHICLNERWMDTKT